MQGNAEAEVGGYMAVGIAGDRQPSADEIVGLAKGLDIVVKRAREWVAFSNPIAISIITTTRGGGLGETIVGIAKKHNGADEVVQLGGDPLGSLVGDLGALREARQHDARVGALQGRTLHTVGHVLGARVTASP